MEPCNSRNTGLVTIITAIVVMTVSVSDQTSTCPPNGCRQPTSLPSSVSFVLTETYGQVYNISSNCFPFNTTLLYVCRRPNIQQFTPSLVGNLLSRKCTGNGWLDDNGFSGTTPPKCEKRKKHCFWPPISIGPNVFVEIDNLNVSNGYMYTNANPEGSYSEGTIATYKCKNPKLPKLKEVQQTWRCIKKKETIRKWMWSPFPTAHSWKWTNLTKQDLLCHVPEGGNDYSATRTAAASIITTESPFTFTHNDVVVIDETYRQQTTQRNIIIGVCGFVALVLIAFLLSVCYKNRLMLGKRYSDGANYASHPSLALMVEEQSKCNQTYGQDFLYANIIPIRVNSETIYTEVETGNISGNGISAGTTVKCTIPDDQLHTIYAEIHHPK